MAKKRSKIRAGARRAGRFVSKGGKSTGIAVLTGIASHFAMKFAASSSETLREHYLIVPGVMLAGGHFLRRKSEPVGLALVGAAGSLAAMAWDARRAAAETQGVVEVQGVTEVGELPAGGMFTAGPAVSSPVHSARSMVGQL